MRITNHPEHHVVLAVDDEQNILSALERIVTREGNQFIGTTDGNEALELMADLDPCLVLMDLRMPAMDGLVLLERMRSEPSTSATPVIVITGAFDEENASKCTALGISDIIKKPFDFVETRFRISAQLRMHELDLARREQSERIEAITTAAQDAIIMIDQEGRVVHWNRAAELMFGYERAEVTGKNLHALIAPHRFIPAHRDAFPAFKESGKGAAIGTTVALRARRKNGEEFPVEVSLSAVNLAGAWCAVGIVRDVTERERAEVVLRLSEQKYQAMVDNVAVGVSLIGPDFDVLELNRQMWAWFPSVDVSQRPKCYQAFNDPPRDSACTYCPTALTLRDGTKHEAITTTPTERGARNYRVVSSPILDNDGRVTAAIEVVEDITEHMEAQGKLRASEERLKKILAEIPVGIVMIGRDRMLRWANKAAIELAGFNRFEEIEGFCCHDVICTAPHGACPILDLNQPIRRSERRLRRGEAEIPVLKSVHEIELGGEKLLLETFVDLTEQKRLETELSHAHKLEAVGQLAAGIAHEINTPTQFVGDSIEFLRDAFGEYDHLLDEYRGAITALCDAPGYEAVASKLREVEAEADLDYFVENVGPSFDRCADGLSRIASIVRAMKEFGHPDAREKSFADLNRALTATLTIARNEYKYVAEVETEFGELPPVLCHVGDLNQVFLNLIVNAAHAIAARGTESKGRIRLRTRLEDPGTVCIEVQDSGSGIPPAIRDRIFDPFFTTKPVGKGTGQGLAIARSIVVDKHRGSITFATGPDEGTTFYVRLPTGAVAMGEAS